MSAVAALAATALGELTAYDPVDPAQQQLRRDYLAHVRTHPDALLKSGPPAHLTASVVVFESSWTQVLLTHHAKARRWFQFGGHLEPGDASLLAAATREGREESGLDDLVLTPGITELHRHALGTSFGRCAEHLDVRFVAVTGPQAHPRTSAESLDVAWWPVDRLPEGPDSDVGRLVASALHRLRRL